MKFFLLVLSSQTLLCAGVFGLSAGKNDSQQSEVVSSLDRFMGNCYLQLAMAHPTENLFFSPLSISSALYMVSLGAKSETHRQILEGLSLDRSEIAAGDITKGFQQILQATNQHQTSIVMNTTNACFLDKDLTLDPEFRNDLTSLQSEVISIDFKKLEEAKDQINTHVEEKTNGLIKNLLDGLDHDTKLIFTNTMYFKGTWLDVFNKNNTHEDFHVNKNTVVKVPMMTRDGRYPMASLNGPDCTMVEVPYKGNVSAVFILPNEGKMEDVEKAFPGSMREWMKKLKSERIILSIPKFSASATIDLLDLLPKLGIKDVFSDNADLSGITKDHKLKVSKAIHKAVVSVDEEGTEAAAAATAIGAVTMSHPPQVTFNRPFLIITLDKVNNSIHFAARIINPQK